jgi:hypothetical protein
VTEMAQDVYRQLADRPLDEPPPPPAAFEPRAAPTLLRDDELAPVIFEEDALTARAADPYPTASTVDHPVIDHPVIVTGVLGGVVIAAMILFVIYI